MATTYLRVMDSNRHALTHCVNQREHSSKAFASLKRFDQFHFAFSKSNQTTLRYECKSGRSATVCPGSDTGGRGLPGGMKARVVSVLFSFALSRSQSHA
jgi:hypothetical protein